MTEPLEPEAPMRRYIFPITAPAKSDTPDPVQIQVLEALNNQNQLLIDLLAAVNGMTSALLCREKT